MEDVLDESLDKVQEAIRDPKKPIKYGIKSFHKNPKFYITTFVWSVVSTAVGLFFYFQLKYELDLEKGKTKSLMQEKAMIQRDLDELRRICK